MNNLKKTTLVVAMTYALSGCATMEDQARTKTEGAGFGALAGGILGYIVTGGDEKGAALGAALGGGLGLMVGDAIASRKQQYASAEETIAGETKLTEESTQSILAENSQLKQDILTYDKQLVSLRADIQRGKKNRSSLTAQRKKMQARHSVAKESLAKAEKQLQVSQGLYQEVKSNGATSSNLQVWQKKITKLKQEKAALETNIQTLNAMNSKI